MCLLPCSTFISLIQQIVSTAYIPGIVLGARNTTVNKIDKVGSFFYKGSYLPTSYCVKIMTLYSVMEGFIFLVFLCYLLSIYALRCEAMKNRYRDFFLAFGIL